MEILQTDIKSSYEQWGIWDAFTFKEAMPPCEQIAELRKQDRRYIDLPDFDCIEAILRGELRQVKPQLQRRIGNKIMLKLRGATWGARLVNEHTENETGILAYLSVGTDNRAPIETQTQLYREIFRKVPLTKRNTGSSQVFHLFMDFEEGNPDLATEISASPASSKTVLYVEDVTGFNIGDAIQVGTSPSPSQGRIESIDVEDSALILEASEALTFTPVPGNSVELIIGESGSHGNADADGTENSGDLFSRGQLRLYKNIDLAAYVRHTFLGVSA